MAVRTVEDPQRFGVVEVKNENVVRIVEKSPNPPRFGSA
jgi:dTDP-glucose pyrophosphorylase